MVGIIIFYLYFNLILSDSLSSSLLQDTDPLLQKAVKKEVLMTAQIERNWTFNPTRNYVWIEVAFDGVSLGRVTGIFSLNMKALLPPRAFCDWQLMIMLRRCLS